MFDAFPFDQVWKILRGDSALSRGLISFIQFLERRLGGTFVYNASRIPFGKPELLDLFELAEKLRGAEVIKSYTFSSGHYDEPHIYQWRAECATRKNSIAGGMSAKSDRQALTATLAEALERYLWLDMIDYFVSPRRATVKEILRSGHALVPERFAGFSPQQRARNPRLTLLSEAEYLWIHGYSWTTGKNVWIPAQIVSGKYGGENFLSKEGEPIIIAPITTGLATGPTREFALLNGALEIIERDAFMITWLNQLTPPRINLALLKKDSHSLSSLLSTCVRYRLTVDAVRLPTDAPAYAVCVVVRDISDTGPAVTIGLRAHHDLVHAVEGALLEALRMRQSVRQRPLFEVQKKKEDIRHMERTSYWAPRERSHLLDFLTQGSVTSPTPEKWDADATNETHLKRILDWCSSTGYECASVDLGTSKKNVSPWFVEMVVIPELIPIHQHEKYPYTYGERIRSIPKKFGFSVRPEPFLSEPHPFA